MRIWTVANQKGGVGKTTTVVSLGGLLAHKGHPTLLLDLDPHGSMTSYFGYDPETVEPTLYDLFRGGQPPDPDELARPTSTEGLFVLPASTALATLDRQLGSRQGMGLVIRRAMQAMAGRFHYTILDCPPMLGVLMVNALAACHHLIIPVQTEFLALKGLDRMVHTLNMIEKSRHHGLSYTIVPTLYDKRTKAAGEALHELYARYGDQVWDGAIPIDNQFREASRAGQPLTAMHPWSRGSTAFRKLLEHLQEVDGHVPAAGSSRKRRTASGGRGT